MWSARHLHNKRQTQENYIHTLSGIRNRHSSNRGALDLRIRHRDHRDRLRNILPMCYMQDNLRDRFSVSRNTLLVPLLVYAILQPDEPQNIFPIWQIAAASCCVFCMLTQALFRPLFQLIPNRSLEGGRVVRSGQGIFWWVFGKRSRGYIWVDQVANPIFWIVELDREGKFALRFVGAYRHNSSLGPLFLSLSIYVCVSSWVLGAMDCSHSICLAIILHRSFSTLVFKHDLPMQLNL